jgi:hypothetical protein
MPSYSKRATPFDPALTLRWLLRTGHATVAESTTFHGVPAYKLIVRGASHPFLNGAAYVARSNYRPLEMITSGERIRFEIYQYLPITPANLRLLHISRP